MKSVSQVHVCVDDGVPGFYLARVTAVKVETRNPGSPEIHALRNGTIAQNNRKWEVNILQIELACGASTENAQSTGINLTLGIGINRQPPQKRRADFALLAHSVALLGSLLGSRVSGLTPQTAQSPERRTFFTSRYSRTERSA